MKARMVLCWHPDSPGGTVVARRRWWIRRPFATLTETIVYDDWVLALRHGQVTDLRYGIDAAVTPKEGT